MRDLIAARRSLVLVPEEEAYNYILATSLQAEAMKIGYIFDEEAFGALRYAPAEWLVAYHKNVLPKLAELVGNGAVYRPFYANFPDQVMQSSYRELFYNAMFHYLTHGRWEPPQPLRESCYAFENVEFRPLRLGNEAEFQDIFTRLVGSNQSLAPADKEAVEWFAKHEKNLVLPSSIPFKETLCLLAAAGLDVPVRTPTDVLRIAVHLSGGDIALPSVPTPFTPTNSSWMQARAVEKAAAAREAFKFRKFKRSERRRILGLLEKTSCDTAEMQGRLGRWLRLGERLHPGEYAKAYPKAAAAFQSLRNQPNGTGDRVRVRSFAGQVDLALGRSWNEGVDLLATRPGELARRLDALLRRGDANQQKYLLERFSATATRVSSKVLLEIHAHFERRTEPGLPRTVALKGKGSKRKTLPAPAPLPRELVDQVKDVIATVIGDAVASLPPLGRVWIDPRLADVPLPSNMRSVNTSVKTYVRGTRIPFRSDAKVVRPFIHWQDEEGEEDLDLSVNFFNERFEPLPFHLSYTSLKVPEINSCHSGDVRCRVGSCAEYVDLDIDACLNAGARYAAVQVFNYQGKPMHTLEDCVFGLMERSHPSSNEIFEPKTVSNAMTLGNESTCVVVAIVDLEKRHYLWTDTEVDRTLAVVETTSNTISQLLADLVHGKRMSVLDLLQIHARGRGQCVERAEEAEVCFRWEEFVTDYSKITSFMHFDAPTPALVPVG